MGKAILKFIDPSLIQSLINESKTYTEIFNKLKIKGGGPKSRFSKYCKDNGLDLLKFKENDSRYQGVGDLSKTLLSQIKIGAIKRNLEYNISNKFLWKLFLEQHKKCYFSGLEIILSKKATRDGIQTASLDRKNNNIGYLENNIAWVHKNINRMKWDINEEEFIKWCNLIKNPSLEINNPKILEDRAYNFIGYKGICGAFLTALKGNANKRQIKVNLDIKDIWNQYEKQKYKCALSGIPINFQLDYKSRRGTASVDRIDSSIEYIPANIQIVHVIINKMKQDFDMDYFKKLAILVSEYRSQKNV